MQQKHMTASAIRIDPFITPATNTTTIGKQQQPQHKTATAAAKQQQRKAAAAIPDHTIVDRSIRIDEDQSKRKQAPESDIEHSGLILFTPAAATTAVDRSAATQQ